MRYQITQGDCLEVLRAMPDASVDSIVTDPPYGLEFMGAAWDRGVPPVEVWIEALRVLKPGGHLLAFAGTRTQHRMATAIEDSGFTIRDMIAWVYGGGFPKSHNLKGEREGWGTALKPALEPITVARKPFKGTVAANVLEHGTGAINIDGCRVPADGVMKQRVAYQRTGTTSDGWSRPWMSDANAIARRNSNSMKSAEKATNIGRWPANLIHDGSPEVLELFPESQSGGGKRRPNGGGRVNAYNGGWGPDHEYEREASSGSAARFFYCPKASQKERNNGAPGGRNAHPTVKPVALMRYLCRLVTPPGGLILDPFTGSGTTGIAAILEGFDFVGAELDPAFVDLASGRIDAAIRGEYDR